MSWILSIAVVFLGMVVLGWLIEWDRARRRRQACVPAPGEAAVRRAERASARIFVDRTIAGGPKAEYGNRLRVDLVLTDARLMMASHQGRLLEIGVGRPGQARCTGPRRLVIEGDHPSGRTRVRAELVVDQAEQWAAGISALGADRA